MSGTKPTVSVLTTAYNREKYLAECVESVLASTFRDFEYIIVDDCSTDASWEIALAYAKKDPRIRVHHNDKNLGDYPNRNRAAELASGKYLKYVDGDDTIYPHGLAVMLDMMERCPQASVGLGSSCDGLKPFPTVLSSIEAYRRHYFEGPIFHKAPLSAIIRASAFRSVGGFSGRRWVGDFELWHVLAAQYPVALLPDGLVFWRLHEDQQCHAIRTQVSVQFEYFITAMQQLSKPECPLGISERRKALRRVKGRQIRVILRQMAKLHLRTAAALIMKCSWYNRPLPPG